MLVVPKAARASQFKNVAGLEFPGHLKLKKTDEFSSVFSFRRRINGKFLAIHYMPNQCGYPRLGVVASKKVARRAVARNYIKRVIRELFRLHRASLEDLDIVVRLNQSFSHPDFLSVENEFLLALTKLSIKLKPKQKTET